MSTIYSPVSFRLSDDVAKLALNIAVNNGFRSVGDMSKKVIMEYLEKSDNEYNLSKIITAIAHNEYAKINDSREFKLSNQIMLDEVGKYTIFAVPSRLVLDKMNEHDITKKFPCDNNIFKKTINNNFNASYEIDKRHFGTPKDLTEKIIKNFANDILKEAYKNLFNYLVNKATKNKISSIGVKTFNFLDFSFISTGFAFIMNPNTYLETLKKEDIYFDTVDGAPYLCHYPLILNKDIPHGVILWGNLNNVKINLSGQGVNLLSVPTDSFYEIDLGCDYSVSFDVDDFLVFD